MSKDLIRMHWQVDGKEMAEISEIYESTGNAARKMKPFFMLRIIPLIRSAVTSHFTAQKGYSGAWARLSPEYSAWKQENYPGRLILQLRRNLIRAATEKGASGNIAEATNKSLEYGVDLRTIPYARVHDMGGRAGRGQRSRIPKREFMYFSKKDADEVGHEAARFVWDENVAAGGGISATARLPWGGLAGGGMSQLSRIVGL